MASDFVLPEFLEDCDADTIHARMMDELPDDIDKTEGGFPWDFTRPTALIAAALLQFYIPEATIRNNTDSVVGCANRVNKFLCSKLHIIKIISHTGRPVDN